ncbi:hypothetical protein R2F25_30340 [Streptomyces sp. UP1A-1]|nr:hypothetical protein [Streptomyces sp. UP1A-1]
MSRRAAGEAYERRWENTDHLFGIGPAPAPAAAVPEPATERPVREGWTDPTANWGKPAPAAPPAAADDAIADADAALRRIRGEIDDTTTRDPELEAKARAIFEQGGLGYTPPALVDDPADQPSSDPRYPLVFEIVTKSGPAGIGPEAIRDVIKQRHPDVEVPHAATIGRWLGADPRVHRPKFGRYALRPTNGDTT